MVGLEPTRSCSQGTWACRYPTSRLPSPSSVSSSYGSRTHLSGLKARYPAPIDERAACFTVRAHPGAHVERVGREALESSSAAFQAAAKPSQLPARCSPIPAVIPPASDQQKRPDVLATPSLLGFQTVFVRVSQAQDWGRGYSRLTACLGRTWYRAAWNNAPPCVLESNSVVKTSSKSRFPQNPRARQKARQKALANIRIARAYPLDAGRRQKFARNF